MRAEALAAYLVRREAGAVVAARLGIERQTVVRWARALPVPEDVPAEDGTGLELAANDADKAVFERLRALNVETLRWVRRSGRLQDARYVVGPIDEHRHDKAACGELTYWLRTKKAADLPKLLAWERLVMNPTTSVGQRKTALSDMRRLLFAKDAGLAQRPRGKGA